MEIKFKPRRIFSTRYSYLITLPHDWLFSHSIGKGSQVALGLDKAGNLIVQPVGDNNDEVEEIEQ